MNENKKAANGDNPPAATAMDASAGNDPFDTIDLEDADVTDDGICDTGRSLAVTLMQKLSLQHTLPDHNRESGRRKWLLGWPQFSYLLLYNIKQTATCTDNCSGLFFCLHHLLDSHGKRYHCK